MQAKPWKNPVKGIPPKPSTMNTEGDFEVFTDLMKKIVHKPVKAPKASSASRVPDVS